MKKCNWHQINYKNHINLLNFLLINYQIVTNLHISQTNKPNLARMKGSYILSKHTKNQPE